MRSADGFDDAQFVVMHPRENEACRTAVEAYRATLRDATSFDVWILEDVLAFLVANADAEWPKLVFDRYCNFEKLSTFRQRARPA